MRLAYYGIALLISTIFFPLHAAEMDAASAPVASAAMNTAPPTTLIALMQRPGFHPVLSVGFTHGGDNIYTGNYSNGATSHIRAGDFQEFGLGGMWQFSNAPVAIQLTWNYHNDNFKNELVHSNSGNNGFNRYPIELMTYYTDANFRIGGGARFVQSPNAFVNNSAEELRFKNTVGAVIEMGYTFGRRGETINLRYVKENYQPDTLTQNGVVTSLAASPSINGSHVGINIVFPLGDLFYLIDPVVGYSLSEHPQTTSSQLYVPVIIPPHHEEAHVETIVRNPVIAPNKPNTKPKDEH